MSVVPNKIPEQEAEELYWKFSEFENLSVDEVKKCCVTLCNKLIENSDTINKVYWGEVKLCIKNRGL